jgi:hypothetical protein
MSKLLEGLPAVNENLTEMSSFSRKKRFKVSIEYAIIYPSEQYYLEQKSFPKGLGVYQGFYFSRREVL